MPNQNDVYKNQKIKCVVWDLDNTLWNGVLLEKDNIELKKRVVNVIEILDSRGILNSIASKNQYDIAFEKLKQFGLEDYFLYPQINWNSKSSSVKEIATLLNIGIDTLAFVDDQAFELDEVKYAYPQVLCIHSDRIDKIPGMMEMQPSFITEDSKLRRKMYQNDIKRKELESTFQGPQQEFLRSLDMEFTISHATTNDLQRAEELTVRTHQLNTTGHTYSYDELNNFINSDKHILLIAELKDKYGSYGKIGLVLIEIEEKRWNIKLLLMSCRVMSRGVGNIMIFHIMSMANKQQMKLRAEFIPTDKNRMMYMTYKFSGFNELHDDGKTVILENDLSNIPQMPDYIKFYGDVLV